MPTAPEIPLDVREAMHDCILSIFWPKRKIVEFLISVGCPEDRVAPVGTDLSRHVIVTEAFSKLSQRDDRGYTIFQTMVDRLSNWTYFDPYYFDKLGKLDRADAESKISQLRQIIGTRNSAAKVRREASSQANADRSKSSDLNVLKKAFSRMFSGDMSPQARGKLFEKFLQEIFTRQSIKMGDAFSLKGEQIDGTFKFEGENYIVEAKWQDPSVSTGQLYHFAYKVDGKMHGRGVFVSVNGFSRDSISAIVRGKMIKTILIDGEDLSYVLEQRISLEEMLDYKIRAAQTRGDVFVCAVRKMVKI